MQRQSAVVWIAAILCLTVLVDAHTYMTAPVSRGNQAQSNTGCHGPACLGPCDKPKGTAGNTAPVTIQRGATITVKWPRNNHSGGFTRIAWAPYADSDTHAAFDNGVQKIVCSEVGPNPGCAPIDPSQPEGSGSGPADGSSGACTTTTTVPLHLADGAYTMQWAWFGAAYSLGDYYSCADYTISGGPTGTKVAPFFYGGDWANPNNHGVCKFFNTNKLHVCINEPCTTPILPGLNNGPAADVSVGGSGASSAVVTGAASTDGSGMCYVGSDQCRCTDGGGCDPGLECNADLICSGAIHQTFAALLMTSLMCLL